MNKHFCEWNGECKLWPSWDTPTNTHVYGSNTIRQFVNKLTRTEAQQWPHVFNIHISHLESWIELRVTSMLSRTAGICFPSVPEAIVKWFFTVSSPRLATNPLSALEFLGTTMRGALRVTSKATLEALVWRSAAAVLADCAALAPASAALALAREKGSTKLCER